MKKRLWTILHIWGFLVLPWPNFADVLNPVPQGGSDNTTASKSLKKPERSKGDSYRMFPTMKWGENEEFVLKVDGDTRYRTEYRQNFDMDSSKGDRNAHPGYMRSRLRFDLTYRELTRVFVEFSDAREWNRQEGELNQHNPTDIQQAYVEFKQADKGPWSVRLGRQELTLGNKRFSTASGWSNLRRRHTGIRVNHANGESTSTFFLLRPEHYETRHYGRTTTNNGHPLSDLWFYGVYSDRRINDNNNLALYAFGQNDKDQNRSFPYENRSENGNKGSFDRYTVGSVWYGKFGKTETGEFDFSTEGAYQFGRFSDDDIRAFFLGGELTYAWSKPAWKPTLGLVANWASGDQKSRDGIAGRFNNLYGDTHSSYGIMDFVNPRNMRELGIVGTLKPTKKLTLELEGHQFWADSKRDTAITPPGAGSIRDSAGRSGRNLGQEISLIGSYQLTPNVEIEAGAAHFFPGDLPRNQGKSDGSNLFYLQTEIKF